MAKVIVSCLLVLIAITAISGQTSPTFQDFLRSGSAHFQAGELELALADVNKAIELNSRSVDAYVLRCFIRNKKDGSDSPEDYDKIIELAPSALATEGFYLARSNFRARNQKWDDALDDLTKAISLNPEGALNYNFRSFVHLMKGNLDQARTDYEKGLKLQPALPSPFVRRGYFRYQKRDLDGALLDFSNAIQWKSDYAEAYADRGIIRGLQGNIDDAIRDIKLAATKNPQSISDKIPEHSFTSPFWELNQFSKSYPSNARAYELIGIFRLLQDKPADATLVFSKAVEFEPALRAEIGRIIAALRP